VGAPDEKKKSLPAEKKKTFARTAGRKKSRRHPPNPFRVWREEALEGPGEDALSYPYLLPDRKHIIALILVLTELVMRLECVFGGQRWRPLDDDTGWLAVEC
jgi:hypothetical protein